MIPRHNKRYGGMISLQAAGVTGSPGLVLQECAKIVVYQSTNLGNIGVVQIRDSFDHGDNIFRSRWLPAVLSERAVSLSKDQVPRERSHEFSPFVRAQHLAVY